MSEVVTSLHRPSNFRFQRWTAEDDALLQRGYAQRRSVRAIARELGRTNAAVQTRAVQYGLTRKRPAAACKPQPKPSSNGNGASTTWGNLKLLIAVERRWPAYPTSVQDAFLASLGAARSNGHAH
jgi:hypothetical protein